MTDDYHDDEAEWLLDQAERQVLADIPDDRDLDDPDHADDGSN